MLDCEKAMSVLKKHKIAEEMYANSIFKFDVRKNWLYICEACDEWFSMELDAEHCKKISYLFSDLSECFD